MTKRLWYHKPAEFSRSAQLCRAGFSRRKASAPLQHRFACRLCAAWLICAFPATAQEVVLHNFATPPRGTSPSSLTLDSAGSLYGVTYSGGPANSGVVYKVNPGGRETVLHAFTGGADGGNPVGALIRDSSGNLYGVTYTGGAGGAGVVFQVTSAGQETVLYNFTGGADGGGPGGPLARDSAGDLCGTASLGGASAAGVVFKLDTAGVETVLYNFTGGSDGGYPSNGVVRDPAGNLYGTAFGGTAGYGVVFKVSASGQETVFHTFTGSADGGYPEAALIRDAAANLYGTTELGGSGGFGTVFELDPAGNETVLHSFSFYTDGGFPQSALVRDSAGNLYGTTGGGGPGFEGVVFELDPAGNETVLYSFSYGASGAQPSGLVRDASGNLYGAAGSGGTANEGLIFEITAAGQESTLYNFPAMADGANPVAGLTRDSAGNLYGTTGAGGASNGGLVFKVDAAGRETILHTFAYQFLTGPDGGDPTSGVTLDSAGNLYGTTYLGGINNCGIIYKLDLTGQETILHNFEGTDGNQPYGGVTLDSSGNLYGTVLESASTGGAVYELDTSGQLTLLYSFTGGADGSRPYAGVIRDAAGNLYGTTLVGGSGQGVVYKITMAGAETVLHTFTGGYDGGQPYAGLIRDPTGNFYGTTSAGGQGYGVVYKLTPAGQETVLYTFRDVADGGQPRAGLIRDAAGNLYGTTTLGGTSAKGVVFELSASGQYTVLYSFTGGADGALPYGGVIRDAAGNLYGTTDAGGKENTGVVFKLTP